MKQCMRADRIFPFLLLFQYKTVPRNYDTIYHRMTCQGARVLALGYKKIGDIPAKEVWQF